MTDARKKRPRDPNQLAKRIVDLATMDEGDRATLQAKVKKKARLAERPKEAPTAGRPKRP